LNRRQFNIEPASVRAAIWGERTQCDRERKRRASDGIDRCPCLCCKEPEIKHVRICYMSEFIIRLLP